MNLPEKSLVEGVVEIVMPQLGESVTEGTIIRWFKEPGDQVVQDEPLFEVSTDKVDSEVPASHTGTLDKIAAKEGDVVGVGEAVATICLENTAEDKKPEVGEDEPKKETPVTDDEQPNEQQPETATAIASPGVRRILREAQIPLEKIESSDPGGRVTLKDAELAVKRKSTQPPRGVDSKEKTKPVRGERQWRPNSIQKRTGEHMVTSKNTSPHAATIIEVCYDNIANVRHKKGENFKEREGFTLTYLPFIALAVMEAMKDFPRINATMGEKETLTIHQNINLALAVDLDHEGLVAPVIKKADELRLRGVARQFHSAALRARTRNLQVEDLQGGTFTISNSGTYGTHLVLPIINQPQVAILSTDGIGRKPVVKKMPDGTEVIVPGWVGMLAMSWDHRAMDGAYAAQFLAKLKNILEAKNWDNEI